MPQQARIKATTVKKISQTKKATRARFKLSKALQATIKKAVKMHGGDCKEIALSPSNAILGGYGIKHAGRGKEDKEHETYLGRITQAEASLDRIATTQRAQPKTRSAKPTIKA